MRWRLGELRGIEHGHTAPARKERTPSATRSWTSFTCMWMWTGTTVPVRQANRFSHDRYWTSWPSPMAGSSGCASGEPWLAVRAVAPHEARILSLFIALQKTRRDRNKPQLGDLLQNLIFRGGGAPQSWLKKFELLAARAAAECDTSPLALILHLRRTWKPVAIWRGYRNVVLYDTLLKDKLSQARPVLRELTTAHRWVAGTWL